MWVFVQLYEKRKKFVKGDEEISIGPGYMTEESEAEGKRYANMHYSGSQKVLCLHNLDMHAAAISTELNRLVKQINRRIAKVPLRGTIQPK